MALVSPQQEMTYSKAGAERRLDRLGRVLAGRRARLAAPLAEPTRRAASCTPIDGLQRYGYQVAFLLALTALLPTVIGFWWRRRKLLLQAQPNGSALRTLRARFSALQSSEDHR